ACGMMFGAMGCPECTRLTKLLFEAESDHKVASLGAGDSPQPINLESTSDLGTRLRLAQSQEARKKFRGTVATHQLSCPETSSARRPPFGGMPPGVGSLKALMKPM